MQPLRFLAFSFLFGIASFAFAQDGLEGVIVETYYVSDEKDSTDVLSGMRLPVGTTTYRIWADLAEGYKMQIVYGLADHPLKIESSTPFVNNIRGGSHRGDQLSHVKIKQQTVALDSYLTIGSGSVRHLAVLKENDPDGSEIGGKNNDGGSARISGGLLTNNSPEMGLPLTEADGLIAAPTVPSMVFFQIEGKEFAILENSGSFVVDDGSYAVLTGVEGVDEYNRVLIAQITTTSDLRFELNFQLLAPYGGVERFVARNPDDSGMEFTHPELTFPRKNTAQNQILESQEQ